MASKNKHGEIGEFLVEELVKALRMSSRKVNIRCDPRGDKIAWTRTLGYLTQCLNAVIRDSTLQELEERISNLEKIKFEAKEIKENGIKSRY